MKSDKKYYSIREVSRMLGIKEHVIRHWDSLDPKTNKLRIQDLSIRTKGGTRFFNKSHIKKILNLKNILKENGKRNYSLDLASKIISNDKNFRKNSNIEFVEHKEEARIDKNFADSLDFNKYFLKIRSITNNLKKLV